MDDLFQSPFNDYGVTPRKDANSTLKEPYGGIGSGMDLRTNSGNKNSDPLWPDLKKRLGLIASDRFEPDSDAHTAKSKAYYMLRHLELGIARAAHSHKISTDKTAGDVLKQAISEWAEKALEYAEYTGWDKAEATLRAGISEDNVRSYISGRGVGSSIY